MNTRLRVALMGALMALVFAVPTAVAYDGEVGEQVDVDGPGQVVCPASAVTATVTVVDLEGVPLEGVEVTWSTGDVGTTNAAGQHTITFSVTANVVVTATTADGAVGSLTITCVTQGIPLPRTDSSMHADSGLVVPGWVYLLVLAVVGPGLVTLAARRR